VSALARELLQLAAELSGLAPGPLAAMGAAMLADEGEAGNASASRSGFASASLNPEGIPIELAVTAAAQRLKFRLVVDPAASDADAPRRFRRARKALDAALALTGSDALRSVITSQLDAMLPADETRLAAYRSGPFCLAAALGEPGAAIYIDARTHGDDAFVRARRWLQETLPDAGMALAALDGMHPVAHLAAVGLEGASPRHAVAKLYWRLAGPIALSSLCIEDFAHPDFARFLQLALAERSVPASGLMLSTGYRIADGEPHDAKINLCGHCLAYDREHWARVAGECTDAFGIAALPVAAALSHPRTDVSFFTFGRTRHGDRRVNCYFRPTARH